MVSGVVLAVFGVFIVTQSLRMDLYIDDSPGPGFFPCLIGVAFLLSGVALFAMRMRSKSAGGEFRLPERHDAMRSIGLWLSVFVASVILGWLGFVLTALLLVAVIMFGIERRRGVAPVIVTLVIPALTWLLFGWLLQVRLPTGPFGF